MLRQPVAGLTEEILLKCFKNMKVQQAIMHSCVYEVMLVKL